MRRPAAVLACVVLAGCGAQAGGLADDAGATSALHVAYDLDAGTCAAVSAAEAASGDWSGARILFRQLPPAAGDIGRPLADDLAETDEHPSRAVASHRVWMATRELSQAQWRRLAGSAPWFQALPFADLDAFVGPDLPALGISPAMAEAVARRALPDGWTLDLPEAEEWELACLAGATGKFAWGDGYAADDAAALAVCDPAGTGAGRPAPIGSRAANAWGLHDLHGNAWEIVRRDDGHEARGGSFDQPPLAARASNRLALDADTAGWNVGVRLVLRR